MAQDLKTAEAISRAEEKKKVWLIKTSTHPPTNKKPHECGA